MPYQPFSKSDRLGKAADITGQAYNRGRASRYQSMFGAGDACKDLDTVHRSEPGTHISTLVYSLPRQTLAPFFSFKRALAIFARALRRTVWLTFSRLPCGRPRSLADGYYHGEDESSFSLVNSTKKPMGMFQKRRWQVQIPRRLPSPRLRGPFHGIRPCRSPARLVVCRGQRGHLRISHRFLLRRFRVGSVCVGGSMRTQVPHLRSSAAPHARPEDTRCRRGVHTGTQLRHDASPVVVSRHPVRARIPASLCCLPSAFCGRQASSHLAAATGLHRATLRPLSFDHESTDVFIAPTIESRRVMSAEHPPHQTTPPPVPPRALLTLFLAFPPSHPPCAPLQNRTSRRDLHRARDDRRMAGMQPLSKGQKSRERDRAREERRWQKYAGLLFTSLAAWCHFLRAYIQTQRILSPSLGRA